MLLFFAEASCYKLSKMKSYHYPNLTMVDESDIVLIGPNLLDNAVVATFPESARNGLYAENIRDAIEKTSEYNICTITLRLPTLLTVLLQPHRYSILPATKQCIKFP